MDLSFAPAIRVFGSEGFFYKYILVKITLGDEKYHFFIRSGDGYRYNHTDLLYETRTEFHPISSIEILGGGFITKTDKCVIVSGQSRTYGPAQRDLVAEILTREYPDHEIDMTNAPTQP